MAARKKVAKKTTAKSTTKKKTTAKRTVAKRKTTTTKKAKATPKKKVTAAKKRTTTTKRTAAKRPATRKTTTTKKTTVQKKTVKTAKISVGKKPFSKSEFVRAIAEQTGLSKKEATSFLEAASSIIKAHVNKKGPKVFSWPGLFKIQVVRKPATKQRKGINPFTKEPMTFKAKPASQKVKIRPLKQLKDMAS